MIVNEAGCYALLVTGALPVDSGPIGCVATNRSGEASFSVVPPSVCLLLTAFDRHLAVFSECNPSALVEASAMDRAATGSACGTRSELCAHSQSNWGSSPHLSLAKGKSPASQFESLKAHFFEEGHTLAPNPGLKMGVDGEGGAWLVVEAASPALGGWYQLTAYNTAGSITTQARVIVETPPSEEASGRGEPRLILPTPSRVIEPE